MARHGDGGNAGQAIRQRRDDGRGILAFQHADDEMQASARKVPAQHAARIGIVPAIQPDFALTGQRTRQKALKPCRPARLAHPASDGPGRDPELVLMAKNGHGQRGIQRLMIAGQCGAGQVQAAAPVAIAEAEADFDVPVVIEQRQLRFCPLRSGLDLGACIGRIGQADEWNPRFCDACLFEGNARDRLRRSAFPAWAIFTTSRVTSTLYSKLEGVFMSASNEPSIITELKPV